MGKCKNSIGLIYPNSPFELIVDIKPKPKPMNTIASLDSDTIETNKLFAEFCGYKPVACNNGFAWDCGISKPSKDHLLPIQGRLITADCSYLKFHSSYEWLMKAVEKAEGYGASIIIGRFFCEIKYVDSLDASKHFDIRIASGVKKNAIFGALSQFINWYNINS